MKDIIVYQAQNYAPLHVNLNDLRRAGQLFGGWFSKEHLWGFFYGKFRRDNGAVERGVKKLVDRGEWVSHPFEKRLVYSVKRVHRLRGHSYPQKMYHELNVTGGLVRFWWGDPLPKQLISHKEFTGKKQIPEWALKLDSGSTILYEFCTEDNFKRVLRRKVEGYPETLIDIEKPFVVFVCDVNTELIQGFIERNRNLLTILHKGQSISPYYFTDARIFREQPLGAALTAPIYLWQDGKKGALRESNIS